MDFDLACLAAPFCGPGDRLLVVEAAEACGFIARGLRCLENRIEQYDHTTIGLISGRSAKLCGCFPVPFQFFLLFQFILLDSFQLIHLIRFNLPISFDFSNFYARRSHSS